MNTDNTLTLATINTDDERFFEFFLNSEKIYAYVVDNLESGPNGFYILSEEVSNWCWDNIGPYRLFSEWGPNTPNSWGPLSVKIEFKSSNDLLIFTLRWG